MSIVKLQVAVNGYQGEPITLYGGIDTEKGVLFIKCDAKGLEARQADHIKCSNVGGGDISIHFRDENIRAAIETWFQMHGARRVRLGPGAERHNPLLKLQTVRIGENGPVYEIAQDINNGQLACLIMAWLAKKQVTHTEAANFTRLTANTLYTVEIL